MTNKMHKDDKEYVLRKIDNEGFDYCFVHYSNFKEIKDEKFHELRKAFLAARKTLAYYLDADD